MHLFTLNLKYIDRTTTREQWKEASRWLRVARNEVEKKIDPDALCNYIHDMMVYGQAVMRIE